MRMRDDNVMMRRGMMRRMIVMFDVVVIQTSAHSGHAFVPQADWKVASIGLPSRPLTVANAEPTVASAVLTEATERECRWPVPY